MHWSRCTAGRCRKHGAGAKAFELSTERFLTSARLEPGKSEPVVSEVANPRHLRKALKKLRKLGRTISRKMEAAIRKHGKRKGFRISKRLRKQYELLARMHAKVANVRKDFLHKQSAAMGETQRTVDHGGAGAEKDDGFGPGQPEKARETCAAKSRAESRDVGRIVRSFRGDGRIQSGRGWYRIAGSTGEDVEAKPEMPPMRRRREKDLGRPVA
ncbi:hypothetical protein A7K73_04945 [Candidatus Methylacidiphilum fumarolicum]|nr:hypothetical protein A7K73_04945 [Candidatus Methylacidiphilum fumarolicum]